MSRSILFLLVLLLAGLRAHAGKVDSLKRELAHAKDKKSQALLNFQVGYRYTYAEETDSGIFYLSRSLKMGEELNLDTVIMESQGLMAIALSQKGTREMLDKARELNEKAIAVAKKHNYRKRTVAFMINKAEGSSAFEALEIYNDALSIAVSDKSSIQEAYIYRAIADEYLSLKQNDLGLEYLNKSIHISDSLKNYGMLIDQYLSMSEVLFAQKNYREVIRQSLIKLASQGKI